MTATASRQATPLRSNWHPDLLANLLRSNRLTLLYGEPSPARDAMLRRGLMPMLGQTSHAERAIRFDAWGALPLHALRAQIDKVLPMPWATTPPATLSEHMIAAGQHHHTRLLLVLDSFEAHLAEPAQRADIVRFDMELAQCATQAGVPLHVLLVVDAAANPALRRYAQWIPDFGRDWLRLSRESANTEWLWSDTDIDTEPPLSALALTDDPPRDGAPTADEAEWPLDLLLDEPRPLSDAAASAPAVEEPHGHAEPSYTASNVPDIELPALTTAPPVHSEPAFGPHDPFAAVAPEPSQTGHAPDAAHADASHTEVPAWHPEPDAQTTQRTQKPAHWWRGKGRMLGDVIALVAAAWLVGSWIFDDDRPTLRTGASTSARSDAPRAASAPVNTAAPANPAATPATAAARTPAPAAQGTAAAPTTAPALTDAQRQPLAVALPPEAGSAAQMVDELSRLVAAPAGIPLHLAPADPSTLSVWRHDALLAARGPNAPPLRVVAPLFNEMIQVIVRVDAPWDYVHQIRSLRLNVGRPEGARARTARVLYRQLFGVPLPTVAINELTEVQALQLLLRRGGPIDAVIVVSDVPVLTQVPAAWRGELRELVLDANDRHVGAALQTYAISRSPGDKPRLAVMNYLVAPGPAPHSQEATVRALAGAMCRAQPTLQARGSALLRGLTQGQQPAVGWPYVAPRADGAACPAEPPLADTRRSNAPALEAADAKNRSS